MIDLNNQKVLILGGSSGIGFTVGSQLYEMGAQVIIASRTAVERKNDLFQHIGKNIGLYDFDIKSEQESEHLLGNIGNIDHLIISIRPDAKPRSFEETKVKEAKEAFDSKFWGPFQFIQKAIKKINEGGSIILTSGIAGEKIYKGSIVMSVINSTIETLCRSLSVEIAPLRINAVSPGFVKPKTDELTRYAENFPLRRLAEKEEVADAFIFLMSNTYVTGSTVVVDGGARII